MSRKPHGHYKMKSPIIKSNVSGIPPSTAQILLWDYFSVNRQTGMTTDNRCRIKYLDGPCKGGIYEIHCSTVGDHGLASWKWSE